MRGLFAGLLVTVGACGFSAPHGLTDGSDVSDDSNDGADDAMPSDDDGLPTDDGMLPDGPPDACVSFSTQIDTCADPMAGPALSITGTLEINTDSFMVSSTDPGTPPLTIASASFGGETVALMRLPSVTFGPGAGIHATGANPLAILVYGDATFGDGALVDLVGGGAGARAVCSSPAMPGQDRGGGGGGGGGGGFAAGGGPGSGGNTDGTASAGGPGGGKEDMPAFPLGGCPGAKGGDGARAGGVGGKGGGAFYLAASGSIQLADTAAIDVGGQGGAGGVHTNGLPGAGDAGGGGGGSGGLIWLEANTLAGGTVTANGGGGGQGSDDSGMGAVGENGPRAATFASGGAATGFNGSLGGAGGWRDSTAGGGGGDPRQGGGGGGGGSAGYIRVRTRVPSPMFHIVSPAPTIDNF